MHFIESMSNRLCCPWQRLYYVPGLCNNKLTLTIPCFHGLCWSLFDNTIFLVYPETNKGWERNFKIKNKLADNIINIKAFSIPFAILSINSREEECEEIILDRICLQLDSLF